MEKIVLKEDFDLVEVYNQLLESRGVIDGIDGIVVTIRSYINKVLSSDELKKKYFLTYVKEEDVDQYKFTIPKELFDNIDTLFMKEPIFNIHLFIMRNRFGDTERELGETNYVVRYNIQTKTIDGEVYLYEPEFNLSFVVEDKDSIDMFTVTDKVSNELVHAKKSFYEIMRKSKYREIVFNNNPTMFELMNGKEKTELDEFIGKTLYLVSKDEINARCNQLYYQLKRFPLLSRKNINVAVKKTNTYTFVERIDETLEQLTRMEEKKSYYEGIYMTNVLKNIYRIKDIKDNPYEFLINLLITRKNYFIRQIDKVKERILYEKLREPIIMGHYDDFRKK